jgi:tetratricopeptide (TPR) repeat protein
MMTILLALMLGAAPIAVQAASQPATAADSQDIRLSQALEAMLAKKNDLALQLLDPFLADTEARYASEKRQIFCADGPEETLLYLAGAAAAKPSRGAVAIPANWCLGLWAKGYILIDMGKPEAGIPFLQKAIAMRPQRSQYLGELGFAYQQLRDWPASLDAYQRAEAAADGPGPDRVRDLGRAWFGRAYVMVELGRWDEAEALLQKCLKLDPNNVHAKNELEYLRKNRPKSS